ncbi:MAG: DUF6268 family outer membrane beta-barrel protein [Duncaniella sp.]|nr:DUF6268 family outer membrane beta-barrel protein [Muribaculum sp.]MCM1254956.1 DUF6268 family outer membrane beta-barrel protein [Duncaniella sp.]
MLNNSSYKRHTKRFQSVILLLISAVISVAQVQVNSDYVSPSSLIDSDGNNHGDGSMVRVTALANLPFSYELDEDRKIVKMWALTLSSKYASLNNTGIAGAYVPDKILNLSLNLTHIRPLSERWKLMASLGMGIYARPNHIVFKSLLANGGAAAVYEVSDNFDLGIGAGLTNSFGIPAILPMVYVNWRLRGVYQIDVSMITGLKINVKRVWNEKFTTSLTALDMDGMSAVFRTDNKWKLYTTTLTRSYLEVEYRHNRNFSFFGSMGVTWKRSSRLTNRKFKNFYKLFHSDDKMHFSPAMMVRIGMNYTL